MNDETFSSRLTGILDGKYSPAMRRSVQTVVLYEANRCLKDRYSVLRPFQRKIALYDTAVDLINTLEFIPPYHRMEIMFRTASGKLPLSPDLAWRRMKLIDREVVKSIVPGIRPILNPSKSHEEACDEFIQQQYEAVSGTKGKDHPAIWEHSHLNIFLAYRMFYKGEGIDPNLPEPVDPNPNRVVPNKKPVQYPPPPTLPGHIPRPAAAADDSGYASDGLKEFANEITSTKPKKKKGQVHADARRAMLKEVKDHLEILRQFEGVIPAEELNKRKKELYLALPPAPGPDIGDKKNGPSPQRNENPAKRTKTSEDDIDMEHDEDNPMFQPLATGKV